MLFTSIQMCYGFLFYDRFTKKADHINHPFSGAFKCHHMGVNGLLPFSKIASEALLTLKLPGATQNGPNYKIKIIIAGTWI